MPKRTDDHNKTKGASYNIHGSVQMELGSLSNLTYEDIAEKTDSPTSAKYQYLTTSQVTESAEVYYSDPDERLARMEHKLAELCVKRTMSVSQEYDDVMISDAKTITEEPMQRLDTENDVNSR